MNHLLQNVLQRPDVWQASRISYRAYDSLPSGHAILDEALHYRGWPPSSLIELCAQQPGIGEMELLLPVLAAHCSKPGWIFFVSPPYQPYPPALQAWGINPGRLLIASPEKSRDILWAAEQGLISGACIAVVGWLPQSGLRYQDLRRLQLACRRGGAPGFFFRPLQALEERSPAALRLRLQAQAQGLAISINKQPGGHAGQQIMMSRDKTLLRRKIPSLSLPSLTSVDLHTGHSSIVADVTTSSSGKFTPQYTSQQDSLKQ